MKRPGPILGLWNNARLYEGTGRTFRRIISQSIEETPLGSTHLHNPAKGSEVRHVLKPIALNCVQNAMSCMRLRQYNYTDLGLYLSPIFL